MAMGSSRGIVFVSVGKVEAEPLRAIVCPQLSGYVMHKAKALSNQLLSYQAFVVSSVNASKQFVQNYINCENQIGGAFLTVW